ncbi:MAG: hypothetical protein C5B47_07135 [Verrucomicrobia bacterium]|nr:MAG: hypothetical protein C5B47_07135 [Verrucomicrobiota bacterium]
MRIIILQGAFFPVPPLLGGAVEKMWFHLAKEFASAGHEVIQISRRHPELRDEEILFGVKHIRITGYAAPRSLLVLKWLDLCYTLRALRHVRTPCLLVTNTFWAPLVFPFFLKSPIYVDVARMPKGQMRLYARASRFRANSRAVAEAIVHEWPAAANKVRVIPNPLPFDFHPGVSAIPSKHRRVLYVGRLHREKGLVLLLKAWSRLPLALIKEWKLQLVGPWEIALGGSGEAFFSELRSLAEATHCVEFKGFLRVSSTLNSLYEGAAIFVYPSVAEQGETFGLAPLEAMAWGCVPIVSSLRCFEDFIQDNTNGLVFDHRAANVVDLLRDKLLFLMSHAEERERLAQKSLEVRASHAPLKIAKKFLKDFQSLYDQAFL